MTTHVARAAVSDGKGGYRIEEIHVDSPGPGEVLVRIAASGLCHTDHKILARDPAGVMGHEGAGTVVETGDGVTGIQADDRVVLNWAMPCRRCASCRRGLYNVCKNRPQVDANRRRLRRESIGASFGLGTLADYALVPAAAVVAIPRSLSLGWAPAATFGCCVMTGWGSVTNVARVPAGASVAVIGAGAVGLCAIRAAAAAGAKTIVAIDVKSAKLELAQKFGATRVLLADAADEGLVRAAATVRAWCDDEGSDFAFECTSVPALGAAPLAMVRDGGMAVQISGIEEKVLIDMQLFEWDKVYVNPLYGGCDPQRDFPRLFAAHERHELKVDDLVTHIYPLERLDEAMQEMLSGRAGKVVLTMGAES